MPFCLDTDVIIEFFRGNPKIIEKFKDVMESAETLSITRITLCELFRGAYLSKHPERESKRILSLLNSCRVLGLTLDACIKFGSISALLSKKGEIIGDADLLIGCIALSHNQTLVTNNLKHFQRIPDLKMENWMK